MKTVRNYHHGDLRRALIEASREMIRQGGMSALSLRRLAGRVGVSRTAAYHYFKDKNSLLCCLAEEGFQLWQQKASEIFADHSRTPEEKYRAYIQWYISYAAENAEIYDLMFGGKIWKEQAATKSLKDTAYAVFQSHLEMTISWQNQGILPETEDSLRLAQVSWATLHGLARLLIDGIYTADSQMDEICRTAATILMKK